MPGESRSNGHPKVLLAIIATFMGVFVAGVTSLLGLITFERSPLQSTNGYEAGIIVTVGIIAAAMAFISYREMCENYGLSDRVVFKSKHKAAMPWSIGLLISTITTVVPVYIGITNDWGVLAILFAATTSFFTDAIIITAIVAVVKLVMAPPSEYANLTVNGDWKAIRKALGTNYTILDVNSSSHNKVFMVRSADGLNGNWQFRNAIVSADISLDTLMKMATAIGVEYGHRFSVNGVAILAITKAARTWTIEDLYGEYTEIANTTGKAFISELATSKYGAGTNEYTTVMQGAEEYLNQQELLPSDQLQLIELFGEIQELYEINDEA